MESYSVEAVLSASDKGFRSAFGNADKLMGNFEKKTGSVGSRLERTGNQGQKSFNRMNVGIGSILKGVGVFKLVDMAINTVTSSIGGAISRFDTLNNSTRSFQNMGFTAEQTKTTMDNLQASIKGLPTPLDGAVKSVQLLAASTGDLDQSQKVFSALNNGILGFGGTTAQVENAILQLSQAFAGGKVDAETWNSMLNSGLGPALNAIAKQMGITTKDLKAGLSDGSVSVSDFQKSLIDLNNNGGGGLASLSKIAQDSTKGTSTGFQNAKTAVVRGVANIIKAIDENLQKANLGSIGEIIGSVGSVAEKALNKIAELVPPVMSAIGTFVDFVKDNGPVMIPIISGIVGAFAAFATIATVTSIATAAVTAFGAVMAFVTSPIGIVVIAVGALIAIGVALYQNWDTVSKFLSDTWKSIEKIASDVWDSIGNFFKDTWKSTQDTANSVWNGIADYFSGLWKSITDGVTGAWDGIKTYLSDTWDGIVEGLSNTWESIKKATSDTWDSILAFLKPIGDNFTSIFSPMTNFFVNLWDNIKSAAASGWEIIKSVIMGPILFIIDLITGDFEQLKKDMAMIWTTISSNVSNILGIVQTTIVGYVTAIVDTSVNLWNRMVSEVVNAWNYVLEQAQNVWNAVTTFFSNTWDAIVNGAISMWTGFKNGVVQLWNDTISGAKNLWDGLKTWFSNTIDSIVNTAVNSWKSMKKWTIDTFNGIVNGAKGAWDGLVTDVSTMINNVMSWFDKVKDINLLEAGKAILDGFLDGLLDSWKNVQKFVGGIGDWIRDHKGPISYDKKLLTPAGNAIMSGLNQGLNAGFSDVQSNVSGMADSIADKFSNQTLDIGTNLENANSKINGSIQHEVGFERNAQPAYIDVHIGKRRFRDFVDDISQAQGSQTNTQNAF